MNLNSTKIILTPATCFRYWIITTSTTKTMGHNTVISFWSMIVNHPGLRQHSCCKRRKPQFKRRTHYMGFSFCPTSQPCPSNDRWEWRARWSAEMVLQFNIASYSAHIHSSISISDDRRKTNIQKYELNLPGFKCMIFYTRPEPCPQAFKPPSTNLRFLNIYDHWLHQSSVLPVSIE